VDAAACLLYGALNLDEQQFGQVYGVLQNLQQEAKLKGLEGSGSPSAEMTKHMIDRFKEDVQLVLTPEQTRIFLEVAKHIQAEPGNVGFNFSF
jgi:hypothetical protein